MVTQVRDRTAPQQSEVVVRGAAQETASGVTAEDIKTEVEAFMQSMLEKKRAAISAETAEPLDLWDLYAIGVTQPAGSWAFGAGPPFLPSQVVRVGEPAFVTAVLILNPFPSPELGGLVPCTVFGGLGLDYEVQYVTLNMSTGAPAPSASGVNVGSFVVGSCFAVDVFEFTPQEEGCIMEMNVCARLLNCDGQTPPEWPFAGFATWVFNPDQESFLDGLLGGAGIPGFLNNTPIRFLTTS